ncbi:MAG TPA: carbohydrate-binding protein [Microlunatus sp.]
MLVRTIIAPLLLALLLLSLPLTTLRATAADDWTVVFEDDFAGTGLPSATGWDVIAGTGYPGGPQNGFGTDEIETMTNSTENIRRQDGFLRITPLRDAQGQWTSGRAETKADYKPANGAVMRMECKLALPDVHGAEAMGYWPACWALGATQRSQRWDWPASGEPDLAESVNGVNRNWSTLHCGYAAQWGGPCGEPVGLSNGGVAPEAGDLWGQQHVYAFEWDRSGSEDVMRWYLDANQVHTVRESAVPADVWASLSDHAGYRLILNVAIGGQFPAALGGGPTAATRPGAPMLVDYVKIAYRGSGANPTPSATPSTSATTTVPSPSPTATTPTSTPTASASPNPPVCTPQPSPSTTTTAPPAVDPNQTAVIEGENYAVQQGVQSAEGAIEMSNGDQVAYDLDFGTQEKRSLVARVASGITDGSSALVEVRLGSATAAPIGSFSIGNTGGARSYRDIPANVAGTTGRHRVFLTVKSAGDRPALTVDKFVFGVTPAVQW